MRILVLGANGRLGTILCTYLASCGHDIYRHLRKKDKYGKYLDNYYLSLNYKIQKYELDYIINLNALTDLVLCQDNINMTYKSNIETVEKLITFLTYKQIHLIHISTDQVYSGKGPHDENNVAPLNVYGLSKYLSEIVANQCNSTILRINYVGKSIAKNRLSLTDWLYNSFVNQDKIFLYNDIKFSPLFVNDLCKLINCILNNPHKGTFNLGSNGSISKAEFGINFAKGLGLNFNNAKIISYKDIKQKIIRPKDMSMDVSKFENQFNLKVPSIKETMQNVVDDYKKIMQ